jgi:hypothetical protein
MDEIRDGLYHWTAYRDTIRQDVHSHFHAPSGTLFDPMEPAEGVGWFERTGRRPERIVLSNRHHWRHCGRYVEAFGVPVLCHEAALHEFADGREVHGFAWGDELAPGVVAHEVGVLCPEETALRLDAGEGALLFADCVIRGPHGELAFVPDFLLGDDPRAVREGLRAVFSRLCAEVDFDTLLMAHGAPVRTGARSMLRTFAEAPTAGAPPG